MSLYDLAVFARPFFAFLTYERTRLQEVKRQVQKPVPNRLHREKEKPFKGTISFKRSTGLQVFDSSQNKIPLETVLAWIQTDTMKTTKDHHEPMALKYQKPLPKILASLANSSYRDTSWGRQAWISYSSWVCSEVLSFLKSFK